MLRNYLLIALRNLGRQKGYAAINILGLALGLACCLLLLLYVRHELSYDRFHEDADALVRVNMVVEQAGGAIAITPNVVAPTLNRAFPEVVAATRLEAHGGVVRVGETVLDDNRFYFADSTFFEVFTHAFLAGDPATALHRPYTVVLTESTARRFFGEEVALADLIGQTLVRNNAQEFEVTGVIADVPANAHYRFDFLGSFASRTYWAENEIMGSANFFTYARLTSPAALPVLQAKIDAFLAEREAAGERVRTLALQPVTEIHLASDVAYDLDQTGDWATVNGFGIVAALILLIACINYMNLATARSARRAKEVGLRKSLGALRGQLVGQFYGESALLAAAGLTGALLLVALALPSFNTLADKAFTLGDLAAPPALALIAGVFVVVTLVAGSYPALVLSRPDPAAVLRGARGGSGIGVGAAWLRKGLVVVQFGISALLIVGTLVVVSQLRYVGAHHLGFAEEHVVTLPISDPVLRANYEAMAEAIEQHPGVVETAGINQIPGQLGWTSGFRPEGASEDDEDAWSLIKGLPAEPRVVEALGLTVVAGRAFAADPPAPDSVSYQFLLNETAVRRAGWTAEDAVGRRMYVDGRGGAVLGVVEDFHFRSLHEAIEPLAIWYDGGGNIMNLAVRLAPGDPRAAMDHMEGVWGDFAPHRPFAYTFVDDVYDRLYRNEERLAQIVSVFAGLAIVIACLGLFGLASFTAEQRRREVGIRKVLGASVAGLVGLLTRDFVVLVAVAFAVAVPAAWWLLDGWLDGFAYRVGLGPVPFVAAAVLLLAIALATVGTQALRAATTDPVQALRHE